MAVLNLKTDFAGWRRQEEEIIAEAVGITEACVSRSARIEAWVGVGF